MGVGVVYWVTGWVWFTGLLGYWVTGLLGYWVGVGVRDLIWVTGLLGVQDLGYGV